MLAVVAVCWTAGKLAHDPKIWGKTRALARFWHTGSTPVACGSTCSFEFEADLLTTTTITFSFLARTTFLDCIGCGTPPVVVTCAHSSELVDRTMPTALLINRAWHVKIVVSICRILGRRCMAILAFQCRTMIEVLCTMALSRSIVTAFATSLALAPRFFWVGTAHTSLVMLVKDITIPGTHLQLACNTIESDVA